MTNVVIITGGSRGDVQLLLALGVVASAVEIINRNYLPAPGVSAAQVFGASRA